MGEPALKTRYQDLYASPGDAGDENQLTLIGLSDDGPMDTVSSYTGMSGLETAEALFGDRERLPHAVREAIEASVGNETPIQVNVLRGGEGAVKAYRNLAGGGLPAIKLEATYHGERGNEWYAMVDHDGLNRVVIVRFEDDGEATEFEGATNQAVVDLINASSLNLVATKLTDTDLTNAAWAQFASGANGTLTAAEILRLLVLLEAEDCPNFLFVSDAPLEPTSMAAMDSHCTKMLSEYQVERFFFVDIGLFDSTADEYSAAWLADMETDTAVWEIIRANGTGARNFIPFAGHAVYYDADLAEYTAQIGAASAAAWVGLPIHRSMVNVQVQNVVRLAPLIPPTYRNRLADVAINFLRTEKGRGVIIGNSRTYAMDTSDFKNAEVLRCVYTCGKEAREAGMPKWGLPDDPNEHDGLDALKDAMEVPLERRKGKTIVDYLTQPEIDEDTNEVTVRMGIQPYSTMETIDHVVYRKRS